MDETRFVENLADAFSKQGYIVRSEISAGYGRADLVLAKPNNQNVLLRKSHQQMTTLKSVWHFHTLSHIPDIDDVNEESATLGSLMQKSFVSKSHLKTVLLSDLEENGFIKKQGDGYRKLNGWMPLTTELIAIEAKLYNWRRGVIQAIRYNSFADKSYLAIPKMYSHRVDEKYLEKYGIGLFVWDEEGLEEVITPTKDNLRLKKFKKNYVAEHFWEEVSN